MAAPTLADARRAADEILCAGVGTVLLFGSLARGEAHQDSDIDLIAIYDDLGDYSDRNSRRCALEARTRAATGCSVDVMVTDAPEWAIRTLKVPCSLEARIVDHAIELADTHDHAEIRWNKEIGLADNPTAEMQNSFVNFAGAVSDLTEHLRPTDRENRAAASSNPSVLSSREDRRFGHACRGTHFVVETAAKLTYVLTLGTAPPRWHEILKLLQAQPARVRNAFIDRGPDIDFVEFDKWHQGALYHNVRPVKHFNDTYLRRYVAYANRIAAFAGEQSRGRGFDDEVLQQFEADLQENVDALNRPLRIQPDPPGRTPRSRSRGNDL
ncbi:nucleotidyltransferase domain-containing protein [Candidatus Poriferisodalis sp.]|uniref:nucleotidyltransferase domain-containing protein n=1 Tax=Candidatus Poriferisodalis sp. TaxID=3101277 RepID=UPI003C6FD84E